MELKLESLRRLTMEQNIDILGFTESNTCWDLIPDNQRLPQRTRGWWENCQWSLAYNRREENQSVHQPGGMGLLCINQMAHRAQRPGDDPLGLGRWSWMRLRGPNGFFLRVVTMYRPCFSNGPLTTYQQQVQYLTKIGRFLNPQEAILIDIAQELQTWQELGDHILLLTDYNDDIESPTVR